MRRILACTLMGLIGAVSAAQTEVIRDPSFVRASVEVDAEGRVGAVQFADSPLPAALLGALEGRIRAWTFDPARVDGAAQPSRTHLAITLAFEPDEDEASKVVVRIRSVSNGPGILRTEPPRYPRTALRNAVEARVLVEAEIDPDGRVVSTRVRETVGSHGSLAALTKASEEAVRKWTFAPEVVAGRALGATVLVPVKFCILPRNCAGLAELKHEGERGPQPLHDGQALALAPAVRLLDSVVDQLL